MTDVNHAVERIRAVAEARLADHPDRDARLRRLERLTTFLEDPRELAVVYLREIAEIGDPPDDDLIRVLDEDVITAVGLLARGVGESYADVVLRSAQQRLAREVLANDVGEELDRLAPARGRGVDVGDRWDLLILCQALLDRAADSADDGADAEPVVVETAEHVATVYLHPVHGDIVVLVQPVSGEAGQEQWVLIDKAHKDVMLLGLIAERLREPLETRLVPWLQANEISHHVYNADEMGGEGTARG